MPKSSVINLEQWKKAEEQKKNFLKQTKQIEKQKPGLGNKLSKLEKAEEQKRRTNAKKSVSKKLAQKLKSKSCKLECPYCAKPKHVLRAFKCRHPVCQVCYNSGIKCKHVNCYKK
tara:strand:+ start:10060 stop:10404 length:345 start_codon:yes stop_codon:yes gene_type:complete